MKRILLFLAANFIGLFSLTAQITVDLTWAKSIGSYSMGVDQVKNSVTDAAGNLYMTGTVYDAIDFDAGPSTNSLTASNQAFLAKYNSSGNLIWAKVITGLSTSDGENIAVDGSGNVYVAGRAIGSDINFDPASNYTLTLPGSNNMFMAKYNSSGSIVWGKVFGALSSSIRPRSLKVNNAGEIFLGGDFGVTGPSMEFNPGGPSYTLTTNGATDGYLAKYSTTGLIQWAYNFGGTMGDYVYAVEIDGANNVYIAGEFQQTAYFNPAAPTATFQSNGFQDMYFAKFTQTGTFSWVSVIGGSLGEGISQLKLNSAGELVMSGYMESASMDADPGTNTLTINKVGTGTYDMFVGKYNSSNGNLIWAKNTGGNYQLWANSLATDAQNNIYVTGSFDDITDFDLGTNSYTLQPITTMYSDIFLAKYNSSGGLIYANNLGGGAAQGNQATGVMVDNSNNITLAGTISYSIDVDFSMASNTVPQIGGVDIFFAKYSQCISPETPTLSATSVSMCANTVATLSIASGNLNSATTWVWTAMSCGSSTIGTGTSCTVSPVFLTNYYVRGEGGCPTPTGSCASASVSVVASKDITGLVTTSLSAPVTGSVMIYRFEGPLNMWHFVGYQNINASGNYTFNAVNSNSYIIKCLPVSNTLQATYAPSAQGWKGATIFAHSCLNTATMNITVNPVMNIGTGPGVLSGILTEGVGYANKGGHVFAPGNPIKGITVKGGRNPGGDIVNQVTTDANGGFTITGLPENVAGESYFLYVDIPGLDTSGTYHKAIITGSTSYTNLDFVADSSYIFPINYYVGVQEIVMDNNVISVYPNPATNKVTVSVDKGNVRSLSLKINDMFGRKLREFEFESPERRVEQSMDISDLSKGIYFIRVRINDSERQIKLIVTE